MAKGVCFVALVLATFASICQACTFGHAGFCVAKKAGDAAPKDGVVIPDGTAIAVTSGTKSPATGYWMPGCSKVTSGTAAPSAGKFWSGMSATPTDIASGAKAASDGVFCPTAKTTTCTHVAASVAAAEDGVAIPDGAAYAVTAKEVAPTAGFYCQGCKLLTAETAAPAAGKHWTTPSATPTSVAKGATAASGVFCADSLKTAVGGGGGGGGGTAAKKDSASSAGTMTSLLAAAILSMVGILGQLF